MTVTYLKLLGVVHARDGLHQVGGRVVAKVRADVTNAQTASAGLQILGVLVGRLVQGIDL